VRVDQLGAHLESYIATLPTITALRLCNRFGTGDNCHVNRLPIELVKLIEEHVVEPEREKTLTSWSRQQRCYEGKCGLFDHYSETQEEVYQIYHDLCGCKDDKDCGVEEHFFCGHRKCEGSQCPAWKFKYGSDHAVLEYLCRVDALPEYTEVCSDQQEEWRRKIGTSTVNSDGIFKEQEELLLAHFGIIVWLGRFSIPEDVYSRHRLCSCSPVTTAHLALPGSSTRHEDWCPQETERADFDIPLKIGPLLTAQSLSRFPRALKLLGLQAWQHPSRKAKPALSPPSEGAAVSAADDEAVLQPQLTLLVST